MTYAPPVSRRMAIDGDGTIGLLIRGNGSEIRQLTATEMQWLNDENISRTSNFVDVGWAEQNVHLIFIFPEKRILTHLFAVWQKTYYYGSLTGSIAEWSADTTNGLDGSWNSMGSWEENSTNISGITEPEVSPGTPSFRELIQPMSSSAAIAVKFTNTASWWEVNTRKIYSHHLYGYKAASGPAHRMIYCDAAGNELMSDFDYGDQPRGTTRVWSPSETWNQTSALYLKNGSPDLVASSVVLGKEGLTGDMATNTLLSLDGSTFTTMLSFASISPGQKVGPIYVRHSLAADAGFGLKAARLRCSVGEWA